MDYKLKFIRPWRYMNRKRGLVTVEAGSYSVPEQLGYPAAQLALSQGMATREEVQAVKILARMSKKKSPANKSRGAAPSNKAALA